MPVPPNYAVERTLSKGAKRSARATNKFARASQAGRLRGAAHGGRYATGSLRRERFFG